MHNLSNELIDTLWNVNSTFPTILLFLVSELIDTLWNVNVGKPLPFKNHFEN